jgi:hypothetical protein
MEINYPFQWWRKYETMFHIVNFLAHKFLGIVELQIEKEKNKTFRRCLLQWDNFKKLIFVKKTSQVI